MWYTLLLTPFLNGTTFGKTTGLFDQKSPYSKNLASYVFFPMVRLFSRQKDCLPKSRPVPGNLHQKHFFPMVRLFARQQGCLAKSRSVPENLHLHHDSFCLQRIHRPFIFGELSIGKWLFLYAFKPCEFNLTTSTPTKPAHAPVCANLDGSCFIRLFFFSLETQRWIVQSVKLYL